MGIFDGFPLPREKSYLQEDLSRVDEGWVAARFDSLPHVVHILTSKDRDGEAQFLKEQSDVIEEVVDEVVHTYHGGFNKAIQNYSQILRLFSESAESVSALKVDLAQAKNLLGSRNKQLHQLWYRSVTLRHIISLLDQIEGIAKVPARIEKLISEKQFYAAVQIHVQSALMLEREGLQMVGALQDVRSELTKLRGILFHKILEDLHAHLYNKGEYSPASSSLDERDDDVPTTTAVSFLINNSQRLSRRTRSLKGETPGTYWLGDGSYMSNSVVEGSSFKGHDEEGTAALHDEANSDVKIASQQISAWLTDSSPDEFLEAIKKSDAPLHLKYLQTMVECLCMLGKVAAAGAIICQRLRPAIHDIITLKIKTQAEIISSSRSSTDQSCQTAAGSLHYIKGWLESHHLPKQKRQNQISLDGTLLSVSPVSSVLAPLGTAQIAAKELLDLILDTIVQIFENHVAVGELLESKSTQQIELNSPKSVPEDVNWNIDSDSSRVIGGYSIGFSWAVLQSECQQLICEILRATPDAASADAAVQTARYAGKVPSNEKRVGLDDGLTFAFRFTDATISIPNQGSDLIRHGWSRRGPNALQEGYGSATVLPEQGIYLAAAMYRPVLQFTDRITSILPRKYSKLSHNGLLVFVENFVKDHFLPSMFVDYRKGVQQAISSPAAFRPRAHAAITYTPLVDNGRPVLHGLLAIDFLAKEVLGWAQAMPKFAGDLMKYVQTFLERSSEKCRALYMEVVLEKQSYMLIGRYDVENLMQQDPAFTCLPNPLGQSSTGYDVSDTEMIESELSDLLLNLRPIKQDNLIRDDNKLILLASLSDSLEYVAESIERLGIPFFRSSQVEGIDNPRQQYRTGTSSAPLASFAEEYRKLAIDCLKVLRVEMQLETVFHMQEMINREYVEDQEVEEPDDFIVSLTTQITRRDEEMSPFIAKVKRNYIFGGICAIAANTSIKALADMKSINLFGVQQICRNSIALEQALAAVPSIDSECVHQRLDRARTYYELLNMPFEALFVFITEHERMFTATEYYNLLKVQVPGREIPTDAQERVSEILSH